jgi:hypothetical protein
MRGRSKILAACFMTLSAAALGCGGGGGGGGSPTCDELSAYHATAASVSFATDVYPILASTDATVGGCSQQGVCHGSTPLGLNLAGNKVLQFLYGTEAAPTMDATMAKSQLLMASVNAPNMQRVVASNVAQSFLSYKISGKDGLACSSVKSMCVSGASVGTPPCGDPMPSIGTLSATDRTKILDWIATGAAN